MFRFTIRDCLWLTLVAAICLAGWQYHCAVVRELRFQKERAELKASLAEYLIDHSN